MEKLIIEGGLLGESFVLKPEKYEPFEEDIVEIRIEDIQSDDDDLSDDNEEPENMGSYGSCRESTMVDNEKRGTDCEIIPTWDETLNCDTNDVSAITNTTLKAKPTDIVSYQNSLSEMRIGNEQTVPPLEERIWPEMDNQSINSASRIPQLERETRSKKPYNLPENLARTEIKSEDESEGLLFKLLSAKKEEFQDLKTNFRNKNIQGANTNKNSTSNNSSMLFSQLNHLQEGSEIQANQKNMESLMMSSMQTEVYFDKNLKNTELKKEQQNKAVLKASSAVCNNRKPSGQTQQTRIKPRYKINTLDTWVKTKIVEHITSREDIAKHVELIVHENKQILLGLNNKNMAKPEDSIIASKTKDGNIASKKRGEENPSENGLVEAVVNNSILHSLLQKGRTTTDSTSSGDNATNNISKGQASGQIQTPNISKNKELIKDTVKPIIGLPREDIVILHSDEEALEDLTKRKRSFLQHSLGDNATNNVSKGQASGQIQTPNISNNKELIKDTVKPIIGLPREDIVILHSDEEALEVLTTRKRSFLQHSSGNNATNNISTVQASGQIQTPNINKNKELIKDTVKPIIGLPREDIVILHSDEEALEVLTTRKRGFLQHSSGTNATNNISTEQTSGQMQTPNINKNKELIKDTVKPIIGLPREDIVILHSDEEALEVLTTRKRSFLLHSSGNNATNNISTEQASGQMQIPNISKNKELIKDTVKPIIGLPREDIVILHSDEEALEVLTTRKRSFLLHSSGNNATNNISTEQASGQMQIPNISKNKELIKDTVKPIIGLPREDIVILHSDDEALEVLTTRKRGFLQHSSGNNATNNISTEQASGQMQTPNISKNKELIKDTVKPIIGLPREDIVILHSDDEALEVLTTRKRSFLLHSSGNNATNNISTEQASGQIQTPNISKNKELIKDTVKPIIGLPREDIVILHSDEEALEVLTTRKRSLIQHSSGNNATNNISKEQEDGQIQTPKISKNKELIKDTVKPVICLPREGIDKNHMQLTESHQNTKANVNTNFNSLLGININNATFAPVLTNQGLLYLLMVPNSQATTTNRVEETKDQHEGNRWKKQFNYKKNELEQSIILTSSEDDDDNYIVKNRKERECGRGSKGVRNGFKGTSKQANCVNRSSNEPSNDKDIQSVLLERIKYMKTGLNSKNGNLVSSNNKENRRIKILNKEFENDDMCRNQKICRNVGVGNDEKEYLPKNNQEACQNKWNEFSVSEDDDCRDPFDPSSDDDNHGNTRVIDERQQTDVVGRNVADDDRHSETGIIDERQQTEAVGRAVTHDDHHGETGIIDERQQSEAVGRDVTDDDHHHETGIIDERQQSESERRIVADDDSHRETGIIDERQQTEAVGRAVTHDDHHGETGIIDERQQSEAVGRDVTDDDHHHETGIIDERQQSESERRIVADDDSHRETGIIDERQQTEAVGRAVAHDDHHGKTGITDERQQSEAVGRDVTHDDHHHETGIIGERHQSETERRNVTDDDSHRETGIIDERQQSKAVGRDVTDDDHQENETVRRNVTDDDSCCETPIEDRGYLINHDVQEETNRAVQIGVDSLHKIYAEKKSNKGEAKKREDLVKEYIDIVSLKKAANTNCDNSQDDQGDIKQIHQNSKGGETEKQEHLSEKRKITDHTQRYFPDTSPINYSYPTKNEENSQRNQIETNEIPEDVRCMPQNRIKYKAHHNLFIDRKVLGNDNITDKVQTYSINTTSNDQAEGSNENTDIYRIKENEISQNGNIEEKSASKNQKGVNSCSDCEDDERMSENEIETDQTNERGKKRKRENLPQHDKILIKQNELHPVTLTEPKIKKGRKQRARKKAKCPHCQLVMLESNLKRHRKEVHPTESDEKFLKRCSLCDYKCEYKRELDSHNRNKHGGPKKLKKCDKCPKMFKESTGLRKHMIVHDENRITYQCANCDLKTISRLRLLIHVKDHLFPEREHKCPHCDFTTKNSIRASRHKLKCGREKRCQCHICGYRSTSFHKLKLHLLTHKTVLNDEDCKYRCDKCDYKTYRHYSLQIHKLNHLKSNEIQYFYCHHCDFKAKRKDNLKTHVLRHIKETEKLQCIICDFTTTKQAILIRHIDKHAKNQEKKKYKL